MTQLQQQLLKAKAQDVKLVSVTVDPDYDTPEVLKNYAEQIGANQEMWKFVTGPKAHVEATVRKGFLQPLMDGEEDGPIHSSRFVVVDREGWIRSFPDGNDPEVVQKLLMDIGDLLRESPSKTP
jgi:protein SCO1/2